MHNDSSSKRRCSAQPSGGSQEQLEVYLGPGRHGNPQTDASSAVEAMASSDHIMDLKSAGLSSATVAITVS